MVCVQHQLSFLTLFVLSLFALLSTASTTWDTQPLTLTILSTEAGSLFSDDVSKFDSIINAVIRDELHHRHGHCLLNGSLFHPSDYFFTATNLAFFSHDSGELEKGRRLRALVHQLYTFAARSSDEELNHLCRERDIIKPSRNCLKRTRSMITEPKWFAYDAFGLLFLQESLAALKGLLLPMAEELKYACTTGKKEDKDMLEYARAVQAGFEVIQRTVTQESRGHEDL